MENPSPPPHTSIILHVDLDCFYAAVEQVRLRVPREQPLAVQQWEGLIAVNYAARATGVVRHDRVTEALRKCPDLHLVHVETVGSDEGKVAAASRGSAKVSLERYRQASRHVFEIFDQHADVCERASIDEAYLDVTRQVEDLISKGCDWESELQRLLGRQRSVPDESSSDKKEEMVVEEGPLLTFNAIDRRLLAGAIIAERIRSTVRNELGYTCSVGIATNKLLAKIASARHKPDQQTVIPPRAVDGLMKTLPLKKVKLLGGKVGEELTQKWGCTTAGDVQNVPHVDLVSCFGDRLGKYVWRAVRGVQEEKVQEKQLPKSMLAAKSFQATRDLSAIRRWLGVLSEELSIRMLRDAQQNHRQPRILQLYYRHGNSRQNNDHSKSCSMPPAVLSLLSSSSSNPEIASDSEFVGTLKDQNKDHDVSKENANLLSERAPFRESFFHEQDIKDMEDDQESGRTKILGQTSGVGGAVTRTTKALAHLLEEASFCLFQRVDGALPCTRLAIAASGYQEGPAQGSQSIQHFFANASLLNTGTSKKSSTVGNPIGLGELSSKPKGLFKYLSHDSNDLKQERHSPCVHTGQVLSKGDDIESSQLQCSSARSSNGMDFVIDPLGFKQKGASFMGKDQISGIKSEVPSHSPGVTHQFKEGANDEIKESSRVTDHVDRTANHFQNAESMECEYDKCLIQEDRQEVNLLDVNVEEQRHILEKIYESQALSKGSNSNGNCRQLPGQESQVAKRKKVATPKPGQTCISRFFN